MVKNIRYIYVVPPITSYLKRTYDINKDPDLRKNISKWFLKKTLKWIKKDKKFKHTKKVYKYINSEKGLRIIYKLLKKFVNLYEVNWYDLQEKHLDEVKDYFKFKLTDI